MMNRINIMLRADGVARADIALTPERTYYRFATESTVDEGEMAAVTEFEAIAAAVHEACRPLSGENQLPDDMLMDVFIDNCIASRPATEQSLARVIALIAPLYPEFAFIEGFRK